MAAVQQLIIFPKPTEIAYNNKYHVIKLID